MEKRLRLLEAENARLKRGEGPAEPEHESNESDELREEIDGLVKHVQWLESLRQGWTSQPLQQARVQLEAA
eukprot:5786625-Pyramimonas_sp.AAC.1